MEECLATWREIKNTWWDEDDFYVEYEDGTIWQYTKAKIISHNVEYDPADIISSPVKIIDQPLTITSPDTKL